MTHYKAAIEAGKSDPSSILWTDFKAAVTAHTPEYPPRRDTVLAEKFQLLIIAFVADNAGVWALHCHNDFHSSTGMMKQIVEGPSALRQMVGTWEIFLGPGGVQDPMIQFHNPRGTGLQADQTVRQGIQRGLAHCLEVGVVS
jgi:hypothetical protein